MSPEGPDKPKDELEEALERLGKRIAESKTERQEKGIPEPRSFESTETGYSGTVSFYEGDIRNVYLRDNNHTSLFVIQNNEISYRELRGPDNEHIDRPDVVESHLTEIERLLRETDNLDPKPQIKDQGDLDFE